MRVVFCGTGDIGLPALCALGNTSAHDLVGVICQPDRPAGRDLKARPSVIKSEALSRRLPVLQPERIRDDTALANLSAWRPDVMVVVAYGQILPARVLRIPTYGCLNLHASLLPRHRGASPIQAAIAAGDAESGITVMYMDEGLDTGDILLSERIAIGSAETAGELHDRLALVASNAILHALDLLSSGTAPRSPQNNAQATYAPKLLKSDGEINWALPASVLARHVRAMSPWPGAFVRMPISTAILKIHKARATVESGSPGHVISVGSNGILVGAGEGSLLLEEVQLEGRKRLRAADFVRGAAEFQGDTLDLSFSVAKG